MGGLLGKAFVQNPADRPHQVDVPRLVLAADIVATPDLSLLQNQKQGVGVILDVKPVADILARAIDRDRLAVERVQDHDRDQLFGEMKRAVIVRAIGQHHRQAVGFVPGADQVIARRF